MTYCRGTGDPMNPHKKTLIPPILLIGVGTGQLLSTLGVAPSIDWIWTIGLATIGALFFLVGGINKVSIVAGPFFLIASCLSLARQTDKVSLDVEIPILIISAGILLLVARAPAIPVPDWIKDDMTRG